MAQSIESILGADAQCLREDFNAMIADPSCTFEDMEELLLGYGLEMDYFDQLLWC